MHFNKFDRQIYFRKTNDSIFPKKSLWKKEGAGRKKSVDNSIMTTE